MARALAEETRAEQLGHHTISSAARHESTCARCGGLMVIDFYMDLLFCIGETEFAAKALCAVWRDCRSRHSAQSRI